MDEQAATDYPVNTVPNNNGSDAVEVKSNHNDISLNVFSNNAYTEENESGNRHINNNYQSAERSPLNTHRTVAPRISHPPNVPPPTFIPPPSTAPLIHPDDDDEIEDGKEKEDEEPVNYTIIENDSSKPAHGILRHRSSVRDPSNAPHKNVTFGKLPRRRGDTNPCLLLLLFIIFLLAALGFLLVLLVIKGSIEVPCSCEKSGSNSSSGNVVSSPSSSKNCTGMSSHCPGLSMCPSGWILSKNQTSCYGMTTTERKQYSEAKSSCAANGGYLLSLETDAEEDWFLTNIIMPRKKYESNLENVLLGLKKNNSNNTLIWESMEPLSPSKSLTTNITSSCYALSANDGKWDTLPCTNDLVFYCERQPLN